MMSMLEITELGSFCGGLWLAMSSAQVCFLALGRFFDAAQQHPSRLIHTITATMIMMKE